MDINELNNLKMRKQDRLIANEAISRGINFKKLTDRKIKMTYGNKCYVVRRGKIRDCASSQLAIKIVKLKDITSRLLRSRGYNAIENMAFNKHDVIRAWYWASTILPVVLKPVGGNLGKLVIININNFED